MKINKQAGPPEDLLYFDDEVNLTPLQVEDVVEIFNTPLTGSYNWDYTIADNRIKKLYELGKELNWNDNINLEQGLINTFSWVKDNVTTLKSLPLDYIHRS